MPRNGEHKQTLSPPLPPPGPVWTCHGIRAGKQNKRAFSRSVDKQPARSSPRLPRANSKKTCNTSEIVWEGCDRCLESGPDSLRVLTAVSLRFCLCFLSLSASSPRFLSHDARIWDRGDEQRPGQSKRRSEFGGRVKGGSTQERHAVDGGDRGRPPAPPAAPGRPTRLSHPPSLHGAVSTAGPTPLRKCHLIFHPPSKYI